MLTIGDKTLFDTFDEATNYFNLTGHIIKIVNHPDSLEEILQNGNVVKCIGMGRTISPGRPSGNQQLHSQTPIFSHANKHPYLFPIFYKKGRIEYMGVYRLNTYRKKMTSSGFHYFEFTFHRESKYYTTVPVEDATD